MNPTPPCLRILGTRGIPAAHGGFETFAEQLALYLVARGWRVVVYCQDDVDDTTPAHLARGLHHDVWQGVERVRIPIRMGGAKGTMLFDWLATRHAASQADLCLTLGYNTALFCAWLRLRGVPNLINMDGIEWARAKWSRPAKAWFWLNDWAGCLLGNHLVADHPEIARHLATRVSPRKISTIAYGAPAIAHAPESTLAQWGLQAGRYLTVVARPEPENSLLEIVQGYSRQPRGMPLVVLGNYRAGEPYHDAVRAAASDEVKFLGAIYNADSLSALRAHSLAYVHGHQVGGTNPSLVEALGAGNAVLAHDNRFNRWVAGDAARYFQGASGFDTQLTELLHSPATAHTLRSASRARFESEFTWAHILSQYETLLRHMLPQALTPALSQRERV